MIATRTSQQRWTCIRLAPGEEEKKKKKRRRKKGGRRGINSRGAEAGSLRVWEVFTEFIHYDAYVLENPVRFRQKSLLLWLSDSEQQ